MSRSVLVSSFTGGLLAAMSVLPLFLAVTARAFLVRNRVRAADTASWHRGL